MTIKSSLAELEKGNRRLRRMALKSRLAELEKDNRRLRRALRPFAKAAEDLHRDDRHGAIPNSWFFDDKWIEAAARAMAMSNKRK